METGRLILARIEELCQERNTTLRSLNLPEAVVLELENAEIPTDVATVLAFCNALEITLPDFFSGNIFKK